MKKKEGGGNARTIIIQDDSAHAQAFTFRGNTRGSHWKGDFAKVIQLVIKNIDEHIIISPRGLVLGTISKLATRYCLNVSSPF